MDTSKGGSKDSTGFDPLGEDPLGTIDDNVVLSNNSNGGTIVDIKANFIDDFESQIDSLVVNTPPAAKIESPVPESIPLKTKGKRTYKKKRSKLNNDSEDSTDGEEEQLESKRFKKETSSNNSNNSNEDSDAARSSTRSRRSSRKSRPNNFYTKNYELESGSGSENEKKSKGKKYLDEEEYTPVKEKKVKTPKSNAGRKPKNNFGDSILETPTATTSETVLNFSTETSLCDDLVVVTANATDASANDLVVSTAANDVTTIGHDVSISDPDVSITGRVTNNKPDVPSMNKSEASPSNTLSTPKKSSVSVRPAEVSNLTEIKIASVSSMADTTTNSSKSSALSNMFRETQSRAACNFIKDALTTTAELGNLLNSKANEFVEKKATDSFMTDTRKLQFCMEKAFVLFNLARNNLSGIEKKLKNEYADFMVKNKFDKLLKCDKNTNAFLSKYHMTLDALEVKSCPERVDSDSDCEIVEVASAPAPNSLGRGRGKKQLPAELDILRRVERNGISWKAKKAAGGGGGSVSSDGEGVQKVQLPGKNPVWINKSICVKKVTPAKNSNRSFFREDGRTLKPPDPPMMTPSTELLDQSALSATRLVDKTALVLGWLDLAYQQTNNFFSILKKMERPKRNDSCSDLGDSCSDDELEDCLTVCPHDSLLKLCLNKMNNIFLASDLHTQKLLEKFDFHLFDDLPEPIDYSDGDEGVIPTVISTAKNIINTCKSSTHNKLSPSKVGIQDDPRSGNSSATDNETPQRNASVPTVGSCVAPEENLLVAEIKTGNPLLSTIKSLGTTGLEKEIDAITPLPNIGGPNIAISGHLPAFEESIRTDALCPSLTSEQEVTEASIELSTSEQAITYASISLPTTEQSITDSTTIEEKTTCALNTLPIPERNITDILNTGISDVLTSKQSVITNVSSHSVPSLDASIDPEIYVLSEALTVAENSTATSTITKTSTYSKTTAKLADAFKYLLESSSNSDSSVSVRTQRKKTYTKRIKKTKCSSFKSSDEDGSISELCKVTDSSDSGEAVSRHSLLKSDPKFYYQTTVDVVPLSAEQLQPFQKYLQELENDLEIEKLLDFSTLIRRRGQEDQTEQSKTKEVVKKKKPSEEPAPEKNLLNLITSELPMEDILDNTLTEIDSKESSVEKHEELIEHLAHKFQVQNNRMAKNFLVYSSSNESSDSAPGSDDDMSRKKSPKTDQKKYLLLSSPESSKTTPKKNSEEDVADAVNELKTPVKKNIQKDVRKAERSELLAGIDSMLREDARGKKKKKQQSASEDEETLWLKKRNRMLSNEKKRVVSKSRSSGSDKANEDSDSSLGSADSQILQTPKSVDPSDVSTNVPSSEQSTPITPKTKNILAQSDLLSDSSDSDSESSDGSLYSSASEVSASQIEAETPSKGRRNIRKVIRDDSLMDTTILAAKEEEERMRRLNEKHSQLTELISLLSPKKAESAGGPSLVLDFDIESKTPLVCVHPALVKILKCHQIDGVKFMWDTCFESVQMVCEGKPGAGCILAHCMGLGKSLQVVALVHTVLTSALLSSRTVLICCPLSTVLNWADEFQKWLRKTGAPNSVKVFELSKFKKNYERGFHLEDWHKTGGVFIIGYEMFRLLTTMKEGPDVKPHVIRKIYTTLLNPGPDLVVCDEGHLLKNDNTALAKVMNKIHTKRRIVLTGTPLQNNLKEYYCMVNFVKPNLLGSRREYFNRFENPISNGQHRDSSTHDINIMKKRSHVLHKMLEGSVQRKEAAILYKYLPRKLEYVLLTTLSKCQVDIYQHYLDKYARSHSSKGTSLLKDFHILQKIWTHPRTLQNFLLKSRQRKLNSDKVKMKKKSSYVNRMNASGGFVCLEDDGVIEEETLASPDDSDWWMSYVDNEALENLETSPKFSIAFKLLDESLQAGDKMLIFCTSLFTLDALEYFLKKNKGWKIGHNYYRLDGSVSLENRQNWCRQFNSERNKEVKLFLISTRAGGLGINMIAANRVIIMDVSWNPSHDVQSIFRVYRFGQKKDCYIYRLVSLGTMEEKIYERSVTKQAVSCRVVDEQQVDRHYDMAELSELYFFNPIPNGPQPIPSFPSDHVLATVLAESKKRYSDNFAKDLITNLVTDGLAAAEVPTGNTVASEQDSPVNCDDLIPNNMSKHDPDPAGDNRPTTSTDKQAAEDTKTISSSIVILTNQPAGDSQVTETTETISSSIVILTNQPAGDSQVTETTETILSPVVPLANRPASDRGKVAAGGGIDGRCLPYVWSMHEHDSLLKDLHEEQLHEEDRKLAWLEYEAEREQQKVVKANLSEMIVPDLKNLKGYKMKIFPVSTIMPNQSRLLPINNHLEVGNHAGVSILPDSNDDGIFQPRSSFGNPRFTLNKQATNRMTNPSVPKNRYYNSKAYTVGRYGPPRPPGPPRSLSQKMQPTMMANMAFQNIQISNITSATSTDSVNAGRKKRKRKVPQYFPTDKASPVMDLTSLPDTPDKDKPPGRRRSTSGKKCAKCTSCKTPKKATPRRSSGVKKSPPKKKKHNSTKKLNFGDNISYRISSDEGNAGYSSHVQESILPEQSTGSTPMFIIDLLD